MEEFPSNPELNYQKEFIYRCGYYTYRTQAEKDRLVRILNTTPEYIFLLVQCSPKYQDRYNALFTDEELYYFQKNNMK